MQLLVVNSHEPMLAKYAPTPAQHQFMVKFRSEGNLYHLYFYVTFLCNDRLKCAAVDRGLPQTHEYTHTSTPHLSMYEVNLARP